ncbi:hypothetical protein IFM89_029508 [Coptis chinensis]|uniref:Chlororespiratory reduction 4 n=1 Tax=Coptis chinensis TaxID=261450 RepID=A0A835LXL4_9MAGN|nr:hypothetical protein IFM89_029508 [Coptis chinensis]
MSRKWAYPFCDNFTFPFVLKACALLLAVEFGNSVHGKIMQMGFCSDPFVQSGLVRMYGEFGEIDKCRKLFDEISERDIVLWNTLIGGYLKCGALEEAEKIFQSMGNKNVGSYNAMLGGYVKLGCVEMASTLFNEMSVRDIISWNTMIGGHARFGLVEMARKLFDEAPGQNVATWSVIISGFSQGSRFGEALEMFKEMLVEGVMPNQAILVSVLSCCAHLGALEQGVWIHSYIEKHGIEVDDVLGASLIDMYTKCGFLRGAISLFETIKTKGVSSWTSLIYGYAIHGHSLEALELFSEMKSIGILPNRITFVAVLRACSHAGLVDRGREIFDEISRVHNIRPTIEHYTCMVDLLSRANLLDEAQEVIKEMPMKPDLFVWGALHGGSRIHGEKCLLEDEDEDVRKELASLEPKDSGAYILMSNIYASNDQWDNSMKMRRTMEEMGVKKILGCSSIEVDQNVHEFSAGGRLHSHSEKIYDTLDHIYREIQI